MPPGVAQEILRAIGSALAVVADSEVSVFVGTVEDVIDQQGDQLHRAELTTATGELALELGELMAPLLRHQLWAAVSRQRASMTTSHTSTASELARTASPMAQRPRSVTREPARSSLPSYAAAPPKRPNAPYRGHQHGSSGRLPRAAATRAKQRVGA